MTAVGRKAFGRSEMTAIGKRASQEGLEDSARGLTASAGQNREIS
jgi:hypothetical protein